MTAAGSEREDFGYEPFTRHDFYEAVNRALVDEVIGRLDARPSGDGMTIVDLGCGTGAVTELVVEALQRRGLGAATIVGVEPSATALAQAEQRLAGSGMDVRFVQGDAAALAALGTPADAVFFCNAIHLVPDKNEAMADVARVLVPGGIFAFNSSFFTGAYAPGTDNFYYLWTVHAIRWLRREHPQIRPSKGEKTLARQWLSPTEYSDLLRDNGFEVQVCELEQVQMNLASFVDIGRYWLFIEGALPGVPLAAGADALEHGVRETFAEKGLSSVPRNWLQVIASRAP
jgi:ubiquinone/menaquinone biosynthesis C-methylase UbiE